MDAEIGDDLSSPDLTGWLPSNIVWTPEGPRVQWILMEKLRLLDPFFEQTVDREVRKPFHILFRRQTSMEELCDWVEQHPSAPLRGLIFHISRCGSTLISQQLATIDRNIVASEPSPLDVILRAHLLMPNLSRETQVRWARAVAMGIGQPRNGESAFYIKFDCWHIHQRDLIREVFPGAPWIFLYRDPVRVMLSHARMPAAWLVPGMLHPMALQMDMSDWNPAELDVYRARALAHICRGGLDAVREDARVLLVNYNELPQAMWGRLLSHFDLGVDDIAAMAHKSQFDAKMPQQPFTGDPEQVIDDRLRSVVAKYLQPLYEELETARMKQLSV